MSDSHLFLAALLGAGLLAIPGEAQAGWQGRRAKCVKPDSAITTEQQQSLSAAVRGGTIAWNAAGEVDHASSSASTHQVLSQSAFQQAWIRYELCVALDNHHIDQATYNRLMEQSMMASMSQASPAAAAPAPAPEPAPEPAAAEPAAEPAGSSSSSATAWQDQIRAQTQLRSGEGFANMASYGYTLLDVAKTGLLDASTSTEVPVSLPNGYEYAIMGVCDDDCSDLDLSILKSGIELAVDTSQDDWPVVGVTPTGSGDYSVKVSMYQCSTKNCGYQLTVWQRPVQAAPTAEVASSPSESVGSSSELQGSLQSGDSAMSTGELYDCYTIELSSGQSVSATLSTSAFDPYLLVRSPSGENNRENDDCDGDRARSCVSFSAEESGSWRVCPTSYQSGESGAYSLQLDLN